MVGELPHPRNVPPIQSLHRDVLLRHVDDGVVQQPAEAIVAL